MPGSTCPKTAGPLECFPQEKVPHYQSTNGMTIIMGVALDGFPIFATLNNGQVQEEPGVDECGGKVNQLFSNCEYVWEQATSSSFFSEAQEEGI